MLFLLGGALASGLASAPAPLEVVATLPDLAALAQAVGGDRVHVTSLARGTEDSHFVDARPSFVRLLNKADLLIEGGAELEIGWLPPLVQNARNAKILPGQPGLVNAAEGVALLDVPQGPVDRSQGDVHAAGNPHYLLDPANAKIVAAHVAQALSGLRPSHAAAYQAAATRFSSQLDEQLAGWTRRMEPFRGTKVLTYHKTYDYFAQRFGLVVVGQLEPKPGLEPSPTHIAALIPKARELNVKLVLIEPFRARKTPDYVARSIGARLVVLPDKVGATEKAKDYFSFVEEAVAGVETALAATP